MFGNPEPEPLVEGRDYLMESGLLVFTSEYLLTRPCCGNGCRNCPYGVNPGSTEPVDKEFA